MLIVVLFGGRPIYERGRHLFPGIAFGTEVANAVTMDLPFGGHLVGTILQDQALGGLLRRQAQSGERYDRSCKNNRALDETPHQPASNQESPGAFDSIL